MTVIWKFTITGDRITVPKDATIIHITLQDGLPTLWAEVDPEGPLEDLHLITLGTGQRVPDDAFHLFTWMEGPFVWHLYEVQP